MNLIPSNLSEHKIVSALDQKMVLDCAVDQDNPLILWKWHQGQNQKWNLQSHGNNKFTFFNSMNSKVISSSHNNQKIGSQVKCFFSKKKQEEIWELIPFQEDSFKNKNAFFIRNSFSGNVLDVAQAKSKNGQLIIQWQMKKNEKTKKMLNQIWLIEPVSFIAEKKAVYKIFSALDYSMVWDASKNPKNQNRIILYPCHKGINQNFSIETFKGKYLILNKENNYSVQVENASCEAGSKIIISKIERKQHELWEILPCHKKQFENKGAYFIRSYCNKYLDTPKSKGIQQAQIFQSDFTGNESQLWFILKQ